jgi:glycosyltransferase involved in cell wall biosynthesis
MAAFMNIPVETGQVHSIKFATTFQRVAQNGKGAHVTFIETPYIPPASHSNWDEWKRVFDILEFSKHHNALLLNSSSGRFHPDVLAIVLLGFWSKDRRPLIALYGDMWQPNHGPRGWLDRLLIFLADRVVDRYIVFSSEEMDLFPVLWNIQKSKMRHCEYFYSFTPEELTTPPPSAGDYVFAGGNSLRDYEPLIEVARQIPERRFVIASGLLKGRSDLPPNVRTGQVSHSEFVNLMKSSAVVVVPVRKGLLRSSGQQTYLNAMMLRKPVIVNEVFGVKDHLKHGETGLVVDGSSESFLGALQWVFDPAHAAEVAQMVEKAHQVAQNQFSKEQHVYKLVKLMEELIVERQAA